MKNKKLQIIIITLSLELLIVSLTQNAIVRGFNNVIEAQSSAELFFMGATAILGGGLFEWIIWLANPLSLFAMIDLWKGKKSAINKCYIALVLAISFAFWNSILGSESGSMATIISLQLGYYLWVLSIVVLTIGTFLCAKVKNSSTHTIQL
jgi:hypothetical protein